MNNDCITLILSQSDIRDVVSCRLVNKRFRYVVDNKYLWLRLCQRDYPNDYGKINKRTYCETYKTCFLLKRLLGKLYSSRSIRRMHNQQELYVQDVNLIKFPNELCLMAKLRVLKLISCELTSVSSEIGKLSRLEHLNLISNQLVDLPLELFQLTRLTELHLYGNQLHSLPSGICKLTKLEKLDLGKNYFTSLPGEIGQLASLTLLGLRKNKIVSLPTEMEKLCNLTCVFLPNNELTAMPTSLCGLTKLGYLNVGGNPFVKQMLDAHSGQLRTHESFNPLHANLRSELERDIQSVANQHVRRTLAHQMANPNCTIGI